MKRTLCIILCLLFVMTAVLTSCGGDGDTPAESKATESKQSATSESETSKSAEESSQAEESGEDKYTDASGKYSAKNLPEMKDEWDEYDDFRVLVIGKGTETTYYSEEIGGPVEEDGTRDGLYDTTDEAIYTAVVNRNQWIEDTYGKTIKSFVVDSSEILSRIRNIESAGTDDFDAAMPFMNQAAVLAEEGLLYDLREFEDYIDLEAPWWDANATASLSIANKVYFTTGDISFMQKIVSNGIAFNRGLMEQYCEESIYDVVNDGRWTLDYMYELCKDATQSLVDDGVMDESDQWGMIGATDALYFGAGKTLTNKDSDDIPQIAIGKEDTVAVAQKVLELIEERDTWNVEAYDWSDQSNRWGLTVKVFGEGQSLLYSFAFSALKKIRAYSVDYGIIPVPKYTEEQENYYSKCAANYAYGYCIPVAVTKDPEYCAYMTELLAIGGKNYISSAYYDAVLKGKDMKIEEDEAMLDKIFGSIVYEVAIVYGFSGLGTMFNTAIRSGSGGPTSGTLISWLGENEDTFQLKIDEIVDAYNAN